MSYLYMLYFGNLLAVPDMLLFDIINGKKTLNISDKMSPTKYFNHCFRPNKIRRRTNSLFDNADNLFNNTFTSEEVPKLLGSYKIQ